MALSIRDARDDDWGWIRQASLESVYLTQNPRRRTTIDDEALIQRVDSDIEKYHYQAKKPEHAFIAELDGERAGVVWVGITDWANQTEVTSWILDVYVVTKLRGKGIAKMLMARAEEWSREQGAKQMWLNVGGSNENALALYRSVGYEVEAIHMSKQL